MDVARGVSRGAGGVGGRFFIENPRRGGGSPGRVGAIWRGAGRVCGKFGGGGAKYSFFGAEIPTKIYLSQELRVRR